MNQIDVVLVQSALRSIERTLETAKSDPDAVRYVSITMDLINAKNALRSALVGNVAPVEG